METGLLTAYSSLPYSSTVSNDVENEGAVCSGGVMVHGCVEMQQAGPHGPRSADFFPLLIQYQFSR
ncbi:hypothetical protein OUZ56_010381 [Daphnia magna]|uniref:Uncharacterized protein n=1 Tax=Daphnia magna TaxID=35525 RepID=A0ABR0AIF0_9CRUS|nr:hypothetical protein OUZ56_010381 [Daphnia magna]